MSCKNRSERISPILHWVLENVFVTVSAPWIILQAQQNQLPTVFTLAITGLLLFILFRSFTCHRGTADIKSQQEFGPMHSVVLLWQVCIKWLQTKLHMHSTEAACEGQLEEREFSAQFWRWMLMGSLLHLCLLLCPNLLGGKKHQCQNEKYVHIPLIHSQLNPHHYLQPALHIIKEFIFMLQSLSIIMECLWSAKFLCVCEELRDLTFSSFPTFSFLPTHRYLPPLCRTVIFTKIKWINI